MKKKSKNPVDILEFHRIVQDFFHKDHKYHIKEEGNFYTYSWKKTRTILTELVNKLYDIIQKRGVE